MFLKYLMPLLLTFYITPLTLSHVPFRPCGVNFLIQSLGSVPYIKRTPELSVNDEVPRAQLTKAWFGFHSVAEVFRGQLDRPPVRRQPELGLGSSPSGFIAAICAISTIEPAGGPLPQLLPSPLRYSARRCSSAISAVSHTPEERVDALRQLLCL